MSKQLNKLMARAFGPYLERKYYADRCDALRTQIEGLVWELIRLRSTPFYPKYIFNQIGNKLVKLNLELSSIKLDLNNLDFNENLYKLEIEYKKYRLDLALNSNRIGPLPDISTLANGNSFSLLDSNDDNVNELVYDNLKYSTKCVECNSLISLCSCLGYPLSTIKKVKVEREFIPDKYDKFFWGDKSYPYIYSYLDYNKQLREPKLLDKYLLILENFRLLRSSEEIRYNSFIIYEQIFYELKTTRNVFRLTKLMLDYVFIEKRNLSLNGYDDDSNDAHVDLEDKGSVELIEHGCKYRTMPEDETEIVFNEDEIVMATLNILAKSEMENAQGDNDLRVEQKENVVLTTHAEPSVAQPVNLIDDKWEDLCSSQGVNDYVQIMSRWQRFSELTWTAHDSDDFLPIHSSILPRDFILRNPESPNNLMFKLYAYFRSDLEIKFVINSNRFHCGQLQASFYYGSTMDMHSNDRLNIYSASQMTHCILDAATASDGILRIPYRHYKPLMATTRRADDREVLDMGTLRIFVLNKLRLPAGDTSVVTITMFYRYVDPVFHGMKPRDLGQIEPQMLGLGDVKSVVNATAGLVNQICPDTQRDNPTDILPPKPFVPWSAHSWCIGDMLPEPTNSLRLQASGNTPHPPGTLPEEPEMDIKYLIRMFGLVRKVNWDMSDNVGKLLFKMPFSPIWNMDDYPSVRISNKMSYLCNILPPLAIISNLFAYWRGSIEYRLDFISTQFHTGRLLIAYLPREVFGIGREPTLEQLTSCDHLVFDLRDNKEISYVNSFLSDKPWWPRRSSTYLSTEIYPPGYIYIMVLNKLTAPQNISPQISFNIYMRAGSDFELHIPINSNLALSYNTDIITKRENLMSYLDNYGPSYTSMYIGSWSSAGGGLVLRYGPVVDHVTQFSTLMSYNRVYLLVTPEVEMNHTEFKSMNYLVIFPSSDNSYAYGAPFVVKSQAERFANSIRIEGDTWLCDFSLLHRSKASDGEYLPQGKRYWWIPLLHNDFEIIGQMDEERSRGANLNINIQRNIKSTNSGMLTFGERITNIKQLLRRYVPYGDFKINNRSRQNRVLADFAVPLMPQGLDFKIKDDKGNELKYGNMVRDGPISILASAYRFYRGSMRLRFMINSSKEGSFWVQHRPEEALHNTEIFVPNDHFRTGFYQPGYASMIQMTKMNEIMEIEIPFYLPGQFGLLQRPDLSRIEDAVHYSLGTLYCGFNTIMGGDIDVAYGVQIFYSMGDDMAFTVFQGFPPVFNLDVFEQGVIAQADKPVEPPKENFISRGIGKIKKKISNGITDVVKSGITEVYNDLTEDSSKKEKVVDAVVNDNELIKQVKSVISDLGTDKQQVIIGIITNLVHSMINPSVRTVVWSIASMLLQVGLLAYSYVEKFMAVLSKLISNFNSLCKGTKKSEKVPEVVVAQSPDDGGDVEAAFVSTCVTGMLALVGAVNKPLPKTLPNFAAYLYDGLPKFSMSSNHLFRFIQNNLVMFKKIYFWLISKFNSNYIYYTELKNEKEGVRKLVMDIQWCLDPSNESAINNDPAATLKVYELANYAQAFMAKKAISTVSNRLFLFESYCQKIIDLKHKLVKKMVSPEIRFEPYVMAIVGDSNLGKSHLSQRLNKELLHSIGYKSYDEIIHTVASGNAYWNGLRNQPICLYDDFLCISDPQYSLTQIGELFALKSKAIFNPPMAALPEKDIRYNPLVVCLCMNKAFPDQSGLMIQSGFAWRRRRDVMIHVSVLEKYKGKSPRSLPKEIKENYGHLKFSFYDNPSGGEDGSDQGVGVESYTYEELLPIMIKRFHDYYDEECVQYDKAIQEARRFHPDVELKGMDYVKAWSKRIREINDGRMSAEEQVLIGDCINKLYSNRYNSHIGKLVDANLIDQKIRKIEEKEPQPGCSGIQLAPIVVEANAGEPKSIEIALDQMPDCMYKEMLITDSYMRTKGNFVENVREKCDLRLHCFCIDAFAFSRMCIVPNRDAEERDVQNEERFGTLIYGYPYYRRGIDIPDLKAELKPCANRGCIYRNPSWMVHILRLCTDTKGLSVYQYPRNVQRYLIDIKNEYKDYSASVPVAPAEEVIGELNNKKWWQKLWEAVPSFGKMYMILVKMLAAIAVVVGLVSFCGLLYNLPKDLKTYSRQTDYEFNEINLKTEKQQLVMNNWKDPITQKQFADNLGQESQGVKYSDGNRVKLNKAIASKTVQQSYEQEAAINAKISRNTFWLMINYGSTENRKQRFFRCLGLVKNYYLILDHYIFAMRLESDLDVFYVRQGQMIKISANEVFNSRPLSNSALMVGRLPINIPFFGNIIKFMVRSKQTSNLYPGADLYEYMLDRDLNGYKMNIHNFDRVMVRNRVDVLNDDDSGTVVNNVYVYPKGARGMCGSVLVSRSNTSTPILGIHVAGLRDGSEGYAEAIVFETFEYLLNINGPIVEDERPVGEMENEDKAIMMLGGNVEIIGCLPRHRAIYPPKESRLIPSLAVGLYNNVTYDVPVMSSNDIRIIDSPFSPLLEGCFHHAKVIGAFENDYVISAYEHLRVGLLAHARPKRMIVGKLSYEEAVSGLSENIEYSSLAMDTSEGFPWIESRPSGATNKSWLFKFDSNNKLVAINDELILYMEDRDNKRALGQIQPTLFVDCLKDAKLPKEKVLTPGKTRIFSISPVDFTIQIRQYFMDFIVAYRTGRFLTEAAIGMDPNGIEADNLANLLLNNSNCIITADYSKFGDTLSPQCVSMVFRLINDWYKYHGEMDHDRNAMVRSVMCFEVMHAQHLMLNLVYKCLGGMPSGNPITVEINSMVNSLYIRIMWIKIMSEIDYGRASLDVFSKNVVLITYGDDLIMSVKKDYVEYFNLETLQRAFDGYGIKFTNSLKSDEIIKYSGISDPETTFLKRTFDRHERRNLWVMRCERRVAEETCNWMDKKQRDPIVATDEVCRGAMELMFTIGREYYMTNRNRMQEFWFRYGIPFYYPTWNEIDLRVYDAK